MSENNYQSKNFFAQSKDTILKPSTNIIGSKPKPIEVKAKAYTEEKEYNKNINVHPEIISRLRLKDNFVMLRLFKYEQDPVSEGGIILKEMENAVTEGGRKTSNIVNNPWQNRGIVVLVAENLKDEKGLVSTLKAGDVIHHSAKVLYGFSVDKSIEVDNNHGYYLVHSSVIDCVELPKEAIDEQPKTI